MSLILAGDVGGTKTLLEVGTFHEGRWRPVYAGRYVAPDYPDFPSVLRTFLRQWAAQSRSQDTLTAACFGVAGPTFDNRAQMTNLPWTVDGRALSAEFGISCLKIVNDFSAAANGVELLRNADLVVLQAGEPIPSAPGMVIGAGTGLGVAYLIPTGSGHKVIAGESGHVGFAPTTLEQVKLWRDHYARNGRVSVEDVVSGSGLARIYEFINRTISEPEAAMSEVRTHMTPAAITEAALKNRDLLSLRALDLFIACYGAVAGDCALAVLARGGVYVAGGIAPRIISRLQEGGFLAAFNAKGVHADSMRKIPLSVVKRDRLGLLGCALIASRMRVDTND